MVVCEGGVFGAWLYARAKRTPSRASSSMAGLVGRGLP